VAALVPVCNGLAMALRMKGRDRVVMTWVGDGATRTGEFHEGVNFAAVQELPCIFVLQNNQVALGTAYDDYNDTGLESLAEAYGIKGLTADGNNVLDVFQANAEAVSLCREGQGPVMLTVNTFRMGGHASHDEAEARELFDEALFADWGKKDPIGCYEEFLIHLPLNLRNGKKGNFVDENRELLGKFERFVQANTDKAVAKAILNRESRQPAEETVGIGVFAE
jgi:TPP-dependent pyruvate/acetoin dehydrogenase alpha subunit